MKASALFPPVLSRSPHCVDAMFMDGQSVFPCGASLYLSGLHAHPASVMAVRPPAQASAMLLANPRIENQFLKMNHGKWEHLVSAATQWIMNFQVRPEGCLVYYTVHFNGTAPFFTAGSPFGKCTRSVYIHFHRPLFLHQPENRWIILYNSSILFDNKQRGRK